MEQRGLGRAVDSGDVDGWVRAIEELLDDEGKYETATQHIAEVRPRYEWPTVVDALARLLPGEHEPRRTRSGAKVIRYAWLSIVGAVIKRGFRDALSRALQMVRSPRVP